MKRNFVAALSPVAALLLTAASAYATSLQVPASQPNESNLKNGLSVIYAYPNEVKNLMTSDAWVDTKGEPGRPLIGLDYPDEGMGAKFLTSTRSERVASKISGYIKFPEAGTYQLQFWSNDGLRVKINGTEVYEHDGRHVCSTQGWDTLVVPEAGYYPIEASLFQRLNTSCVMLKWRTPSGVEDWAPLDIWAYEAK